MQFWQRFTVVTLGALALHGAALWALQTLKLRSDLADKVPALLTRMLELPKLEEAKPPPLPPPPPAPPPKPVAKPIPATAAPSPAPQPRPTPAASPAPMPLAANNPSPAPNAPTGSATPAPAAPAGPTPAPPAPAPVAASPTPVPPAPSPAPVAQLPVLDVEHGDNQYRAPYPRMSLRLGEEGRVLLRVMVGLDGKPTGATVSKTSGSEHLDRAGIETVMRWRFKPGTRGGAAEAMSVLQPVDFKLPS